MPILEEGWWREGESGTWPVILFLRGCGPEDWGDDGNRQTRHGLADPIPGDTQRFPALAVLPQMRYDTHWLGIGSAVALSALQETLSEFRVDESGSRCADSRLQDTPCRAAWAWALPEAG